MMAPGTAQTQIDAAGFLALLADRDAAVAARETDIEALKAQLRGRDLLIEKLRFQLAGQRRHRFGATSEALDQLERTLEEAEIARAAEAPVEDATGEAATTGKTKTPSRREPLPAHLPRNETVLSLGDHLPLYQQSRIFARDGIDLERSTLADWVGRSRDHLRDFEGWMQADGYAGFEELYRAGRIRKLSCMARIRRHHFVDVHKVQGSPTAEAALTRIARLCAVEKPVRGRPPDIRKATRQEKATRILDDLVAWLRQQLPRISGKTPLASAIPYALTRIPRVSKYLDHRFLALSSSVTEPADPQQGGLIRRSSSDILVGSRAGGYCGAE